MKNIIKIAVVAVAMASVASCNDFFPSIPGTQYDLEDTFTDRNKTEEFLNNVYNYVPDETCERWPSYYGGGIWTGGSIEGDITWSGDGEEATSWSLGTAYASTSWIDYWYKLYYQGISKASTFITNLDDYGLLIVDRGAVPKEGSVMLMTSDKGFRLQRATKPGVPSQDMWGVVTWHIKRP